MSNLPCLAGLAKYDRVQTKNKTTRQENEVYSYTKNLQNTLYTYDKRSKFGCLSHHKINI